MSYKLKKSKKTTKKISKKNTKSSSSDSFDTIPLNPIRQKFYTALNNKDYINYIITLLTIYIELEKRLRDFTVTYKDHTLQINKTEEGLCGELFGGGLFYIIYLEARSLNIFNPEDKDILHFFEVNKTIDIDARTTYSIDKWNEEYNDTTKKQLLDGFSILYLNFVTEQFNDITTRYPIINTFLTQFSKKNKLLGLNFSQDKKCYPNVGPNNSFSISIDTNYTNDMSYEMRPQINTCIENINYCDHLIEILTRNEDIGHTVNIYKLNIAGQFMGRNIFKLCMENIDRLYRTLNDRINVKRKYLTQNYIILKIKKLFKLKPLIKTKYMQGFYRVQMIHTLLNRIKDSDSPELNNLKNIFVISKETINSIFFSIQNNPIIRVMCSNTLFQEKFGIIRQIKMKNAEDRTLHDGEQLLLALIDIWLYIHETILVKYRKKEPTLIDYHKAPDYHSSNSNNNKSPQELIRDLHIDVDFTNPDWEKTINNIDLLKIYKIFFNKVIPISQKKLIIKKIKKFLKK